ncbi:Nucleic acid-binding protein [Corchorus olitorius]|uniref:Nucleic acid-binding protein n=1 Tax=Corchorus olitorius TaxID=93759 RepID=A0A1R3JYY3_9ROSI|nr:Nucleic acid-binding protein [Corchorus olitorius]
MDSSCRQRGPVKLFHCTLGKLKPGLKAFIVVRVARMWDIVLPDAVVPIRTDLLLVDHDGSTMQTIMPKGVSRRFSGKIVEGCVYKFMRFDTVVCKLSYLVVPSEYIIYLNSSTSVEEITKSINFDYPRYFFRFATLEDLRARNEKSRISTDVIGVLTAIGSKTNVKRASGNSTDRRDIMIKLQSNDDIMVKFWGLHVGSIDEGYLMSRPSNPVMVITSGIVKEFDTIKYISSSSATKIYIDIDIPESRHLKQRFDGIIPHVKLLIADESQNIESVANPIHICVDELFYLSLDELRGQRYRVEGKIVEMDTSNGITEQTYKRGLKKFKVYSYDAKEKANEPVVLDKGKKVVDYSGKEVIETDGDERGNVECNESVIVGDVVCTPQLHDRKREGGVPVDVPDSPCIPHDMFDTDSPNKKSRKDQDCEEVMKGKDDGKFYVK